MRFDVNRICELAGLGAASGGLMKEAAAAPAPAKPGAPAAKAPAAPPAKPAVGAAKAPAAPAAPVKEDEGMEEMGMDHMEEMDYNDLVMPEGDAYEMDYNDLVMPEGDIMDNETYEIDEYALMEALVDMRQRRLEESNVRDAVRDEIKRALSDRSGSWVYGANKPTNSRPGQVSRGGFGIGFGNRR
jgi:hypothetical protein